MVITLKVLRLMKAVDVKFIQRKDKIKHKVSSNRDPRILRKWLVDVSVGTLTSSLLNHQGESLHWSAAG